MIITTRSGYQFNEADVNRMATLNHEPFQFVSYLPVAAVGVAVTTGQKNKIQLATTILGVPNGFDLYITPQGSALRFIGTGLGNGDTARFKMESGVASESTNQSAILTYKLAKRHYTELDFQNAVDVPGPAMPRTVANNSIGAIPIFAGDVELSDGDLLELNVETDTTLNFILNAFTFNAIEKHDD